MLQTLRSPDRVRVKSCIIVQAFRDLEVPINLSLKINHQSNGEHKEERQAFIWGPGLGKPTGPTASLIHVFGSEKIYLSRYLCLAINDQCSR